MVVHGSSKVNPPVTGMMTVGVLDGVKVLVGVRVGVRVAVSVPVGVAVGVSLEGVEVCDGVGVSLGV